MLLAAVIIVFLILLTALYVAAEFAAVGARRGRLRRLAEDGNPLATRILPVLEIPARARPLHRRLTGRHHPVEPDPRRLRPEPHRTRGWRRSFERVARVGPGDRRCRPPRSSMLLVLTVLAMILGELVPKSLALQDPTRTALARCCRCSGR